MLDKLGLDLSCKIVNCCSVKQSVKFCYFELAWLVNEVTGVDMVLVYLEFVLPTFIFLSVMYPSTICTDCEYQV